MRSPKISSNLEDFHWLRPANSPPHPPRNALVSYEWEMKHSPSSHFLLQRPKTEASDVGTRQRENGGRELRLRSDDEDDRPEKPSCDWDFNLSAVVSSSSVHGSVSDTIGVTEFDPSFSLLATGGIARKIRIYSLSSLLPYDLEDIGSGSRSRVALVLDHAGACDYYICTPAKLSSLRWKPGQGGRVLGSGDYDGVVTEYDLERKLPVFERDEHGGKRVWSMDYSQWDPVIGASGSDDGTMQMWDTRCDGGKCLAAVRPSKGGSAVCCVEFNPFAGAMVAVGCADRKVYSYDVRRTRDPLFVFEGHQKSVTYVRFLDHHTVVTSSVDGCLKMWHTEDQHPVRTYKGHTNTRSFVGLSVWRHGGLFSCGSESNQVFVYDRRWGDPIWVHDIEPVARGGCDRGFVNSVCWGQRGEDQCILVAGGSDGVLRVFDGKRR